MILRILLFVSSCIPAVSLAGEGPVRFNQDIRPILSQKCFQCHGPDQKERQAHLRLDRQDGDDGAYREHDGSQAIQPGSLDGSAVWYRINTTDPNEMMPPEGAHIHGPLTATEKKLLGQWIVEGARYDDFWSFVPPQQAKLPEPKSGSWRSSQPIDRFVMARLEQEGLQLNPPASRRTLIRRVTFDLTGLPPTPEEIATFLGDPSERAYENLVDRLLESPRYGEHMARFWLDLVRFADTNGLHHDHYRQMTPYRDWVIRAFNDNLSFDQFATYQIAGDLFPEPSVDQQIASGFNRLHLIIDSGTALPEESFTRNVIDRVTAVGTAFLGLTVQCAVCHDHKYDPITQKDFYQLFAFFNNFDGAPETEMNRKSLLFRRGLQTPYIEFPTPEQKTQRNLIQKEIARLEKELDNTKPAGDSAEPSERDDVHTQLEEQLKERRKSLESLEEKIPATHVMKERSEVRPAHILIRGIYDQPGEPVDRDVPAFLPPMEKTAGLRTRTNFAEWLVAPSNPLTARVTVNRFWQQFFGTGIVKTSENFGTQGEWPSHPKLLDHLSLEFVQSGWDIRKLVRDIVLSETYQQSSDASPENYTIDPENRLLARGPRFRLDAEMIRDQVLFVGGLLNPTLYGKSVKPPQPAGLWTAVAMPSSYPRIYEADKGDQIYRRSVYTFWKRAVPPPQMAIFDAPMRESCIARRERTNTPLQALVLMNEQQYFQAALHCAIELLAEPALSEDERIRLAYEQVTSQLPGSNEMVSLQNALQDFKHIYTKDPVTAQAITANLTDEDLSVDKPVELASWTMLVHSILNLDITKTRQ